jgi:acyl-[acyl-carrier-protein]-phospholipid O-acyltransferase/long-chain-fatty-acid--[acyl-carrier-protein] ligase
MKTFFRLLLRWLFRFRAYNEPVLTTPGPVLLIPNHVSWLDWLFLWVNLEEDWKFVVSSVAAQYSWFHRRLLLNRYTFPIDARSPYAVKRMAEFLQRGGRLVLFAEGQISHTGTLMKIYDGTGFLLFKTQAKVITCYLRGANRLRWSRQPGWRRWWPRVSAHFSAVLPSPKLENFRTSRVRARLTQWLRDQLVRQQLEVETEFGPTNVLAAIAETARQQPSRIALQDFTMQELTGRQLLLGTDLLAGELAKALSTDTVRVGVLLPNVNATPVTILSLWSLGKVPAVLNFSLGATTMMHCAQLAGLKHVITSRAFVERARLNVRPFADAGLKLIYLEDVRTGISSGDKITAWLRHLVFPHSALRIRQAHASAVVLFTSGSEGVPKGVELTHANLLANIRQMLAVMDIEDRDRLFNALPLFHSFGLTVGTLLGLVRGIYVFLYASPLHYRLVPALFYDRNCTIFLSTNTFLNGYARKAHPYDFRALRYLFAAAEKLQEATVQTWSQRFGVRVLEGYGATECAPCVSVNTPLMPGYGTVGRLMPGMDYRLEPVAGVTEGGRLLVRGPNVMRGYLNADADAAFQALGGWYDTGDVVSVDAEGYLRILGRLKRFAKVSGEMVSLTAVEDALAGAFPQFGLRCQVAVVARLDAEKGEALIAVTNEPRLQLANIRAAIQGKGMTNLCVPREVKCVREIPKLGTGKVDHRELAKMMEGQC